MTPLEEKQRRNRFYFFVIFWMISVAIAGYQGYQLGKEVGQHEVQMNRNARISHIVK